MNTRWAVIIILADDCTYRDLEFHGGQAKTPHLNRLAAQGMKFTRCFQAAPMCSPTRHNLYSGLYPVKSGAYMDSQVGDVLAALASSGAADDTCVLFLSEQGSGFPFAKWTCYDAGLQSAAIARWPGVVKPGGETDAMVEYVDVLPTFLAAAGLEIPKALDGESFLPVLNSTPGWRRRVTREMPPSCGPTVT